MKKGKKIIAVVLYTVMILSLMSVNQSVRKRVQADTVFTIISPTNGSLIAAGHIDINWTDASSEGKVKDYKLYVDGKLVTTTAKPSYEFYTTKVNYHTAFVVVDFDDGTTMSTPNVRFGVTKKGLCVNSEMGAYLHPDQMNMAWYYNWGIEPFSLSGYNTLEYVPMIWGTGSNGNIPSVRAKNYKYVLGYNEPDMIWQYGGSNIDVNTAINNWGLFKGIGRYVGAPAPANSPSWSSGTWLRTFMNRIDQSTVDFIPLHCYYDNFGGAAGANTFLKEVVDATYEMYHKPIWITEFAVSGWRYDNAKARESVKEFLKTAIDGLNKRDYVVRYSWFSFDTVATDSNGASALWTNSTGKLTDLGKTYVEYGNPTTDYKEGNLQNNYTHSVNKDKVTTNTKISKPTKAKIKSVKNLKGRKIKVSLKKIKKAAGYQIKWSDSRKFKGYWKKNTKKTTYTLKKLDRNTRYYIKARAYVKNGSKKLYGAWSKVKKIKVKK